MQDTSLDAPEEVRGLIRAGRAAVRLGDYDAARIAFEQAVARDPENVDAREGLADARRRLGIAAAEAPVDAVEYCYRHPDVETGLHCVQCNRPICARCSYPGVVGQLCPECRRGRRSVTYQVDVLTLARAAGAALVIGAIGSVIVSRIPIFYLILFFGVAIGEGILRIVDWATHSKRGRPIQVSVTIGLLAGIAGAYLFQGGRVNLFGMLIFLVISLGTAVTRLR